MPTTDYSTLSITIDRTDKTPRCEGTIAVKEMVKLTIVGGAQYIASGLVLKIQGKNNKGATTPIAVFPLANPPDGYTNTWTATGTLSADAQCYLNMNTAEALSEFENVGNLGFKPFNLVIMTTGAPSLDANGVIAISQFPTGITADPVTLSQVDAISDLTGRIITIESRQAVSPSFSDFADIDFSDLSTDNKRNAAIRLILSKLQGS